MHRIFSALTEGIPFDTRTKMTANVEKMVSELKYLKSKGNKNLEFIFREGWTDEMLKIVGILSAFNHYVIGPLFISGKFFNPKYIGMAESISYGTLHLNEDLAQQLKGTCLAFTNIVKELSIPLNALYASHMQDIIYHISASLQEGHK